MGWRARVPSDKAVELLNFEKKKKSPLHFDTTKQTTNKDTTNKDTTKTQKRSLLAFCPNGTRL